MQPREDLLKIISDIYVSKVDERQLHQLIEQMPLAICIIHLKKIFYINQAFAGLFGYKTEELKTVPITTLLAPECRRSFNQNIENKILSSRKGVSLKMLGIKKNGIIFPMNVQMGLLELPTISVAIGFFTDLTELTEMETKARENLDQHKKALEGVVKVSASFVEHRDPYTAGHEKRVTEIACRIATDMGMNVDDLEGLRIASTLHDIGKIAVPFEILNKPGRLAPTEFEIIKAHPKTGFDILEPIDFPWSIAEIVLQHHERLDGSGYPQGLKKGEIRQEALIIGVADVVEAMSSHRPYRATLGVDAALDEIRQNKGRLYDRDIADTCIGLFEKKRFELQDPFLVDD